MVTNGVNIEYVSDCPSRLNYDSNLFQINNDWTYLVNGRKVRSTR